MEQQLLALQAEKQAAMAAAAKLVDGNTKKSSEYEAECAKLRAELEAIGKEKNTTISKGEGYDLPRLCLLTCLPACLPAYLPAWLARLLADLLTLPPSTLVDFIVLDPFFSISFCSRRGDQETQTS